MGFIFSEQDIQAEFGNLDKDGTGFLWASDMKSGILKTLDKKFQELLQEASAEEGNAVETTTCNKLDLEAAGGKNFSSKPSENSEEVPLPSPPDGGWGWVIVFACFMCNLVISKFLNIYYSQILTKLALVQLVNRDYKPAYNSYNCYI